MSTLYLERRDIERNMARFYAVTVTPTLFGEWAVVREWGRIGSPGTVREERYESEQEAVVARDKLGEAKSRRGYLGCLAA